MLNLLRNAYDRAEQLKGRQLLLVIITVFLAFLIIGIAINYFTYRFLNSSEETKIARKNTASSNVKEYTGIITYVNPQNFPQQDISYYLAETTGKEIVLLQASDRKLEVSEGLYVTVYGREHENQTIKKTVLNVEKIVIKGNN